MNDLTVEIRPAWVGNKYDVVIQKTAALLFPQLSQTGVSVVF